MPADKPRVFRERRHRMDRDLAPPDFEQKVVTREQLAARVATLPRPLVLTNGVFDILHRGHVTYLARARALGACLVVAVNADASVRELGKGDDRRSTARTIGRPSWRRCSASTW